MMENRSGNLNEESPPELYVNLFGKLRTPWRNLFKEIKDVEKKSPTALWILELAQQRLADVDNGRKYPSERLFFMDNFHTWHTFAKALKIMTNGTSKVYGTAKFTNVDAKNCKDITMAISLINTNIEAHGCWFKHLTHTHNLRNYNASTQKCN